MVHYSSTKTWSHEGFLSFLSFHPGLSRQVSGKMDLGYQISKFLDFSEFLVVAQLEQPLETKMQEY